MFQLTQNALKHIAMQNGWDDDDSNDDDEDEEDGDDG